MTVPSILDTDILSEYLKGHRATGKSIAWLVRNEEITPVSDDYRTAATIKAKARRLGSVLELPDCLIAAVAVRLRRPLVTGNTDDFRAIQSTGIGLAIENWRYREDS